MLLSLLSGLSYILYIKNYNNSLLSDIQNYDRFFWNKHYSKNKIKEKYKVVIAGAEKLDNGRVVSDETLVLRMVNAVSKLGWKVKYYDSLSGKEDEIIEFNPDFILTTIPKWSMTSLKPLPFKIYSFIPLQSLTFLSKLQKSNFSKIRFKYNNINPHIFTISDGLILTDNSFLLLKELYENISRNKFHGIVGYPGVDYHEYDESVVANKIIYYGINWDNLRGGKDYLNLYYNLFKKGVINYYGPFIGWINNYRSGWKGFLTLRNEKDINTNSPFIIKDTVLETIKKHGIVLILHSHSHFNNNLPSLREFEAAAASSIIISDELNFVKDTFGDSALYIEVQNKTPKEIEDQILKHYKWIIENPNKTKIMTKKAHDIYKEKFTLEKLFIDIAHMHESVIKNETVDDSEAKTKLKLKKHVKEVDHIIIPAVSASY